MKTSIYKITSFFLAISALGSCSDDLSETPLQEAILVQDVTPSIGENIRLAKGMGIAPTYAITPENAENPILTFTSSDPSVIGVDDKGAISANDVGQAYVNINQWPFFKVIKSISVKVMPVATEIFFHDLDVFAGTRIELSDPQYVGITPSDGYNIFDCIISDPEVIAFEDNALLPKKRGNATVTIKTKDGSGLSASATVTVREAVPPTDIVIASGTELALNETMQIPYTVLPEDATTSLISWSSSDERIVSVNADGMMTANDYGEAVITGVTSTGVTSKAKVEVVKGKINDYGMGIGIYKYSNGAKATVTESKTSIIFKEKQRADLIRGGTWLNADRYPIVAIKIGGEDVDKVWHNYDIVSSSDKATRKFGNFDWKVFKNNVIMTPDGCRVAYADIRKECAAQSDGYYTTGEKWAYTFTIKTGTDSKTAPGYDFYWFKSFRSMEELKEFLENENK